MQRMVQSSTAPYKDPDVQASPTVASTLIEEFTKANIRITAPGKEVFKGLIEQEERYLDDDYDQCELWLSELWLAFYFMWYWGLLVREDVDKLPDPMQLMLAAKKGQGS
ncbi:hypothetical protein TWF696_002222 [Orbilia brochopaga]|uniref:Uncharacterized protein n=1 Tax=Orbilia brochopaga TaxID=3140254 RepID=A0AAV9U4J8_9PEZI